MTEEAFATMTEITLIDLLRHGEPVGGRRYRGQTDDPLSEKGWRQMWSAVQHGTPWGQVITSPLLRCSDFARALVERSALPLATETRFQEVNFGSWEGCTATELRRQDSEILRRFYRDPVRNRPRDAEPLDAFCARVTTAFLEVLERHRGQHVLIVTHAGVIRAVLSHVLSIPLNRIYRISVANGGVTRVRAGGERPPRLIFHGTTVRGPQ
jgi:alpha-ribazole phosphatase